MWQVLLLWMLSIAAATAQSHLSGALQSYYAEGGNVRTQQYFPEGDDLVCVNGSNRFTRALYGSPTEWRIETSDRPVFALYKNRRDCRNVRFILFVDDIPIPLDSTDYCEARYSAARRSYVLRDKRFGAVGEIATTALKDSIRKRQNMPEVRISVVACQDTEQAVWRIETTGFSAQTLRMQAVLSTIVARNFSRSGDLGADKPGGFEANERLMALEWNANGVTYCMAKQLELLQVTDHIAQVYSAAELAGRKLAGRISFKTPDPYINVLGGALTVAADGDWDGKSWLHGCIGWRMPLAGWRAAYAGDVLGWPDRAVSHFNAYAKSQVTTVEPTLPHPTQDAKTNGARAAKEWGTQMYSNGYICRYPEKDNQMHHYDMNLNYMDELLWHFQFDADTTYMRAMWPVITKHLAWEKRNYDPDGDHLYDAYCCIWASDALYYSGSAVTHASAYNYRGHLTAARIAEIIGEDPTPYRNEAKAILQAMDCRLWMEGKGVWAEYEDAMGLKRKHESPALWSVYTPIDCGACSPFQAWKATEWVTRNIPHIPVDDTGLYTVSTSNWMPYSWSINNVAPAEVMHTALAYFEAGRNKEGYRLLKANIMDNMFYGQSPANFGQLSHYDAARGECYRDFGDVIGISARTLIQGLFGIVPQALDGQCILQPGFPSEWDSVTVETPYLKYTYTRRNGRQAFDVYQNFHRPLKIIVRQSMGNGYWRYTEGTDEQHQVITIGNDNDGEPSFYRADCIAPPETGDMAEDIRMVEPTAAGKFRTQDIDHYLNAEVDDIFKQQYRSPRPQTTTLQIPYQGVGEWCHPLYTPEINDSVLRTLAADNRLTVAGIPFRTPAVGRNIVYTSLWDNYPDAVTIPLKGKASCAWLLMAGSTNHMQCRIDNGLVIATYKDGTSDTLRLKNPDNWCPIEQDFYVDGKAFHTTEPRPYRICLGKATADGKPIVSRDLGKELGIKGVYGREIPGGAAQLLGMPLNREKKLQSLTIRTLSNDVVIGLMAVTLGK